MPMRVAVLGAGSWGTAFSMICADAGHDVMLWAREEEVVADVNERRVNSMFLGAIEGRYRIPEGVRATGDPDEALAGADLVVLAIPSHVLRSSLEKWAGIYPRSATTVSLVKGIEFDTRMRASEIVRDIVDLPDDRVAVLSGPNFARELAQRMPSATVVACPDEDTARRVQQAVHTDYFRPYTNPDRVGVEMGGAVKNVIAIAVGIAAGMGYGDNTSAMLITRGLAEMSRLGHAYGGNPMTFAGLAGVGDLLMTCMSGQSRNRTVGEALGRGQRLEDVIAEMKMVAEGVKSSRGLLSLAHAKGVDAPILEHMVKVLHEGMDPREVRTSLMARELKSELQGFSSSSPPSS